MPRKLLLVVLCIFGVRIGAATFSVTNLADSGPGTLREAIQAANTSPGDDTIEFSTTGTIALLSSLPPITDNASLSGPGTNLLTVSGNNAFQILVVDAAVTSATVSNLTFANGLAVGYQNGAAINNAGSLSVVGCAFINNTNHGGWGGAVFNEGMFFCSDSSFIDNQVVGDGGRDGFCNYNFCCNGGSYPWFTGGGGGAGMGGAIFNNLGEMVLLNCFFAGNSAFGGKGGNSYNPNTGSCGFGGGVYGGGRDTSGNTGYAGGFGSGGAGAVRYAGNGGFGGGGGACVYGVGGAGGLCGGNGGYNSSGGGGGGGGFGGAVFLNEGTVSIVSCAFTNNAVMGGTAGTGSGGVPATSGSGLGPDYYNRAGVFLPQLLLFNEGGGSVASQPPVPPFLSNSWAAVEASPDPGWQFLRWLGDDGSTNPVLNIQVSRNKALMPLFGTQLAVSPSINVRPQAALYPYGTVVKLTAFPPAGTYFSSWVGSVSGTNNPLSIVVTNPNPSISFLLGVLSAGQFSLAVIEDGGGQVSHSPQANAHTAGATVSLTAIPDPGQVFLGWSGDATGTNNPLLVAMTQSKIITANFTKRPSTRAVTPLEGLNDEGFRMAVLGEFGAAYNIHTSTNLLDWSPVGAVTNTWGTVQFIDPGATNQPKRFYRAVAGE